MELDGQIYQLIKMKKISQQMQPQRHQSDRGNVDGTCRFYNFALVKNKM